MLCWRLSVHDMLTFTSTSSKKHLENSYFDGKHLLTLFDRMEYILTRTRRKLLPLHSGQLGFGQYVRTRTTKNNNFNCSEGLTFTPPKIAHTGSAHTTSPRPTTTAAFSRSKWHCCRSRGRSFVVQHPNRAPFHLPTSAAGTCLHHHLSPNSSVHRKSSSVSVQPRSSCSRRHFFT